MSIVSLFCEFVSRRCAFRNRVACALQGIDAGNPIVFSSSCNVLRDFPEGQFSQSMWRLSAPAQFHRSRVREWCETVCATVSFSRVDRVRHLCVCGCVCFSGAWLSPRITGARVNTQHRHFHVFNRKVVFFHAFLPSAVREIGSWSASTVFTF